MGDRNGNEAQEIRRLTVALGDAKAEAERLRTELDAQAEDCDDNANGYLRHIAELKAENTMLRSKYDGDLVDRLRAGIMASEAEVVAAKAEAAALREALDAAAGGPLGRLPARHLLRRLTDVSATTRPRGCAPRPRLLLAMERPLQPPGVQ